MKHVLVAFIISLFAVAAIAGTPASGDIIFRIKDAAQRPVENVTVIFEYKVTDPIFGILNKKDIHKSDYRGIVEKRLLADFNTDVRVTFEKNLYKEERTYLWVGGALEKFINLPLLDFSIKVVDSEGKGIGEIPLKVETKEGMVEARANASGYAVFRHYNRKEIHRVTATYGHNQTTILLKPDGFLHTIRITTYTLEVVVIDDDGVRVPATIEISYYGVGPQKKRSLGGMGIFRQLPEGNVSMKATLENRTFQSSIYLNMSRTVHIIADTTPPLIFDITLDPPNPVPENEVYVFVNVTDPGKNASGIPEPVNLIPPVIINYTTDGIHWEAINTVKVGEERYRGILPPQPEGVVVRYDIIAWDNAGNIARKEAAYTVAAPLTTPEEGEPDFIQLLLPYWWIIPLIIIFGLLYWVKKEYF